MTSSGEFVNCNCLKTLSSPFHMVTVTIHKNWFSVACPLLATVEIWQHDMTDSTPCVDVNGSF